MFKKQTNKVDHPHTHTHTHTHKIPKNKKHIDKVDYPKKKTKVVTKHLISPTS